MSTAGEGRKVVPLGELSRADAGIAGSKAANLGELAHAGLPVPDGFVVTGEPDDQVLQAARRLGDVALAVRSSGVAEDLAGASFAGQYETVLDVRGPEALIAAVRRCRESASSARVERYREARAGGAEGRMAVLVQRMLVPEAAGVAFTSNPITGARGEVVIEAARGLGERVVSGEAVGDEWVVTGGEARCRRSAEQAISAEQALAVGELARRVERLFGAPQDVEWAIDGGKLQLLQARPMTALPEPIEWKAPSRHYWVRNLRLGEWLPEPMTPLFQDWLLERLEEGLARGVQRSAGAPVRFPHVAVNGWYYTSPSGSPRALVSAVARSRGRVLTFLLNALVRVGSRPEVADRKVLRAELESWRRELLPRYRELVESGEARLETTSSSHLTDLVDEVGLVAGEYFWSLALVGGSAWKMEGCLARFLRQYAGEVEDGVQVLLIGLPGVEAEAPAHAVQSLDWYRATAGELALARPEPDPGNRRARLVVRREAAEAACKAALAGAPAQLSRFETLLALAQRYAAVREEQARDFTLAWPLLRRCVLRLGASLRDDGAIDQPEDVFFLMRAELQGGDGLREQVVRRRAEWERRRRLVPPLAVGRPVKMAERAFSGTIEAVRTTDRRPAGAFVGHPASPGRAVGPVRVVRGPEDFDRFQTGEVLVAQATAPAWTPLFARAAAVITDGGSLAAHASLVAREYGIPAVVGVGDASARLRDGRS